MEETWRNIQYHHWVASTQQYHGNVHTEYGNAAAVITVSSMISFISFLMFPSVVWSYVL